MSETKRIRVQKVETADPRLYVTLDATDGGIFPTHVAVDAEISNAADQGHYHGLGTATTNGTQKQVEVTVPFVDANYNTEDFLEYRLQIKFSNDGINWTPVPDSEVTGADGTAVVRH